MVWFVSVIKGDRIMTLHGGILNRSLWNLDSVCAEVPTVNTWCVWRFNKKYTSYMKVGNLA
jgi:hypothetical protein